MASDAEIVIIFIRTNSLIREYDLNVSMNPIIEINRNRYARLVEDQMQNNGNYRDSMNHLNEIINLIEKGAEITYHENPNTNAIYCEARLILDQMDNLASEQILTG